MGWTTQELTAFLGERNVPESAYSFDGDKDDAYCIRRWAPNGLCTTPSGVT